MKKIKFELAELRWMSLEPIINSEVSQKQKKISYIDPYIWNLEELYKKCLNDQDNLDGMVTHLEPDILEYKVKGPLGSIATNKASESDGISVKLFNNP